MHVYLVDNLGACVAAAAAAKPQPLPMPEEGTLPRLAVLGGASRLPLHHRLFCAGVGAGTQLLLLGTATLALGSVGAFPLSNRWTLLIQCVVRPWLPTWNIKLRYLRIQNCLMHTCNLKCPLCLIPVAFAIVQVFSCLLLMLHDWLLT